MKKKITFLFPPYYHNFNSGPQTNEKLQIQPLEVASEWLMLAVQVHIAVDEPSQPTADEWAHPVNPVAGKVAACDGRSE